MIAKQLREHAVRFANDYGYNVANDLDEAAARIEALEMQIQEDTVRLDEDAAIMEKATARIAKQKARIEALENALRWINAKTDDRLVAEFAKKALDT